MKKVIKVILIILLIGALVTAVAFLIKGNGNSQSGYTDEDLQGAYDKGYQEAKTDNIQLKNTIEELDAQIRNLQTDNSTLSTTNSSLTSQVTSLINERDSLITERDILTENLAQQNDNIDELSQTISRLNVQITNLNGQIEALNNKINANLTTISSLNDRIVELQRSVAKYQEVLAQFETDDKAIVTFEFAGSIYSVQAVAKGEKVIVETPTSSAYIIFNGWTLNGEAVDLTTYIVTENVRFIADVTYKYVVNFTVDGTVKSSQVIEKGDYATAPTNPKKSGYTFKYWTLDGETEVHFEQLPITANTTFIAKFVELHTVTFQYDNGEVIVTRRIEHGTTTNPANITEQSGYNFVGWTIDGNSIVDVKNTVITSDTVFVAKFVQVFNSSSPLFGRWRGYCEEGTIYSIEDGSVPLVIDTIDDNTFGLGCALFTFSRPTVPFPAFTSSSISNLSYNTIEFDVLASYEDTSFVYSLTYDAETDRLVGTVNAYNEDIYHVYFVRDNRVGTYGNLTQFNYADFN